MLIVGGCRGLPQWEGTAAGDGGNMRLPAQTVTEQEAEKGEHQSHLTLFSLPF